MSASIEIMTTSAASNSEPQKEKESKEINKLGTMPTEVDETLEEGKEEGPGGDENEGQQTKVKFQVKEGNTSVVIQKYNLKSEDDEEEGSKDKTRSPTAGNDEPRNSNNNNNKKQRQQDRPRQGRLYATKYAEQPGGVRVDEMLYGLKMAHLSCTDDTDERLQTSGANTLEALKLIVGEDNYQKPLSALLQENFNLNMDCWMDESGFLRGKPVDTQGFIASNETTIVLSYRFTTSTTDWLTNLSMWSSEWEPDRDEVIGHAGWCSCFDGRYTRLFTKRGKPRVHTGFYNNFIYTIPHIRKYIINKILKHDSDGDDDTPKKIYIVGCSLGAAIASMAFCFLLEELEDQLADPSFKSIERLICVTAGSPRLCDKMMYDRISDKMRRLRPTDRVANCRLVYNNDLVPHIPFGSGFVPLDKLVYITSDGDILVNPDMKPKSGFAEFVQVGKNFRSRAQNELEKNKKLIKRGTHKIQKRTGSMMRRMNSQLNLPKAGEDREEEDGAEDQTKDNDKKEDEVDEKTPFEIECETTPGPIKDHMPFWYLTYLQQLQDMVDAGEA